MNENENFVESNDGCPIIWNCCSVPLPRLNVVPSKKQRLGYKVIERLLGRLGEGRIANS